LSLQPGCSRLLASDLLAAALSYSRTCRDELTNDHVLFETHQVICLGLNGGSVNTRVVSWKDAAARKLSVLSDALVTPSNTVWAVAAHRLRPAREHWCQHRQTINQIIRQHLGITGSSTFTRRSICRMMTSMCLSLIYTPVLR